MTLVRADVFWHGNCMTQKASKVAAEPQSEVWRDVLNELRLLRHDLSLLLFQDDVSDYKNAEKIKQSYQRATKQHPPVSE